MIRIAIVIDSLAGGGAEKVMLRLASALQELGHDVNFIVINKIISHSLPENISPIFVNDTSKKSKLPFWQAARSAYRLQRILDSIRDTVGLDAVLSNLPQTDRIVRRINNHRVFYCIHNSISQTLFRPEVGKFRRWLKLRRLRSTYRNQHLIYVSQGVKQDIELEVGVLPRSAEVIYNPLPFDRIKQLSLEHQVPMENYFIHVGRFTRQKRHDRLLKLFKDSQVAESLVLMGEGSSSQVAQIHRLVTDNDLGHQVVVMGFHPNPFPYIRGATALLLTSDYEGLPTVILEALACGTPVIAYDCVSGPREILTGDLREFLIEFDHSAAFVAKIREISANRKRVCLSPNFIKRFSSKTVAMQYVSALDSNRNNIL